MNKSKFHLLFIPVILIFLTTPHTTFALSQQIALFSLPGCTSDVEGHYKIANEYLNDKKPTYSVVKESSGHFGRCNDMNIQSTKFEVKNVIGQVVGEISVDGDNNKIKFTKQGKDQLDTILPIIFVITLVALLTLIVKGKTNKRKN